jgi:hypothetical protein
VPFKGSLSDFVYQLVGGLRAGMGYCGARTIDELRREARFIQVSTASVRESHPHDIAITQEAPNYSPDYSSSEAGRDLARLLGWTLSLALLGLDGAGHSLHAASPTRRPAQLQIPRNARPLPPREPSSPREQVYPGERAAERERRQQREAEYQYDRDFEEEVRADGVARVEPARTRPVSTERMENHSVRSRPAVVRLTLLDEGDSSHPRNSASAGEDRFGNQPGRLSGPHLDTSFRRVRRRGGIRSRGSSADRIQLQRV